MHAPKEKSRNQRLSSKLQIAMALVAMGFTASVSSTGFLGRPVLLAAQDQASVSHEANSNDLRRLDYLRQRLSSVRGREWYGVMQLYASAENELGLYNEALRDFPLVSPALPRAVLPKKDSWQKVDAIEAIIKAAASVQVIFINEAHHDAHTRVLTLELLPHLYAAGYRYLAVEAVAEDSASLAKRGYPLETSGSEYLHEPIYGEIIRKAIAIGYKIIPYDADTLDPIEREEGQAKNLYDRVFREDPRARVVVHAGYAHIDKGRGELGSVTPLAAQLQRRLKFKAISVNQTQFRETLPEDNEGYRWLVKEWDIRAPAVFVNKREGMLWSAKPKLYDVNVVLPRTGRDAVLSGGTDRSQIVTNTVQKQAMLSPVVNTSRPAWVKLGGTRRRLAVASRECHSSFPCLVEAKYSSESPRSVAADRYVFFRPHAEAELYLYPGEYRLSYTNVTGGVITERKVVVH